MNRLLTISFAVAALFFATASFAQNSDREHNHIEVSTRVEEQITPDIIYLAITIDEQNSKTLLEAKEREMIKALQSLGIDIKEALTVNDMSSDLKKYFLKKDNVTAKKSYTLKLNTAKEAASVFESLNGMGISDINLTKCAVSPELEQQVKNRLLSAAAKKAKENASILAEAVGSQAGKAIYIQNYYSFSQPAMVKSMSRGMMYATANDAEEAIPALDVSKTTISVNVVCKFALLP